MLGNGQQRLDINSLYIVENNAIIPKIHKANALVGQDKNMPGCGSKRGKAMFKDLFRGQN
ncbi:MAG: hypothetical protein IPJ74_25235 [Saprospiraceae bacterium]|nr:hypothetical protein [Saprospiraceae bacterium]